MKEFEIDMKSTEECLIASEILNIGLILFWYLFKRKLHKFLGITASTIEN
jgi:hypothetical protein